MDIFFLIFFFIFGISIGSFLNVVVLRYGTGFSFSGRSMCFSCSKPLGTKELVPVFSYLWQQGKCLQCKSGISWQYPAVESITGILFLSLFWKLQYLLSFGVYDFVWVFVFFAILFSSLIVISVYDIKHQIVPNIPLAIFLSLSFASIFFSFQTGLEFNLPELANILSGLFTALPFYVLWAVSSGRWIGFGDGNLALGAGWLFGASAGFSAIVLAFWLGAGIMLLWLSLIYLKQLFSSQKTFTIKRHIPFGPFLVLSYFLTFLFDLDVFNLII